VSGISSKVVGVGRGGFSAELRVDGLEETMAALRALAPEVDKGFKRKFRLIGTRLAGEAEGMSPVNAHGGYGSRLTIRGKRVGLKIFAKAGSPAGKNAAIFEFAGTRMQSKDGGPITGQGAAMVRWLDGYAKPGRFLWYAWDSNREVVRSEIADAMLEVERVVQEKLDAAGETY
jgi:hypothetical protein